MSNRLVTIIVPCYNEESILSRSIPAILSQNYQPKPEVIFIDDGSTDKTVELIAQYSENSDTVKLLHQDHGGPAKARNLAASHAHGQILVFIDADMTPEPGYVSMLVEPINRETARGTFTSNEKVGNVGNYWADCWSLSSGCETGERFPENYPKEAPVFRALLKKEFDRIGGYSDVGSGGVGEDLTISEKLGYSAIDAPLAICFHNNPAGLTDYWHSAAWYGKGWIAKYGSRTLFATILKRNPIISCLKAISKGRFYHMFGIMIFDCAVIYGMTMALLRGNSHK